MTVRFENGQEIRVGAEAILKDTYSVSPEQARKLSPRSASFEEMCRDIHALGPDGIAERLQQIHTAEVANGSHSEEANAPEGRKPVEVASAVQEFVTGGKAGNDTEGAS